LIALQIEFLKKQKKLWACMKKVCSCCIPDEDDFLSPTKKKRRSSTFGKLAKLFTKKRDSSAPQDKGEQEIPANKKNSLLGWLGLGGGKKVNDFSVSKKKAIDFDPNKDENIQEIPPMDDDSIQSKEYEA